MQSVFPLFAAIVLGAATVASGQEKLLRVSVVDLEDRPVKGVELTLGGASSTETTNDDGKARIALAPQTMPGDEVELRIVRAPKDFVFISPWDKRVRVPQFRNASDNAAPVVLAERGIKLLLQDPRALRALAATINYRDAPGSSAESSPDLRRRAALDEVAKSFNLQPDEMLPAIDAWGKKSQDPFEKALADLTARNYPAATAELLKSREMRLAEFEKKKDELFEVNFFLGRSLFEEGKYQASADAYREALALRNEDHATLNNLALSLQRAGKYAEAEPLYKRSLAIKEKALGADHPEVAVTLNNLAGLYEAQGKYAEAEPLYKRDLAITEKALGADHPSVAVTLNNLAGLYEAQGKYAEAEPLYKRALAIVEKALGDGHPNVATVLGNYAGLLRKTDRVEEAAKLEERAKNIRANHARQNPKK